MGASSQFNDGVQLKILPTLSEVFLRHLSYCRRQAFQDDGYDKINVKTLSVILSLASTSSEILLLY